MYIQPVIWLIRFYHYTSFIFAWVYLYTYFLPHTRILCLSLRRSTLFNALVVDPGLGSGRGLQHHQSHCDLLGQGPGCGMTSVVTNENIQKGFGITVHTRCFCWNSWGMLRDLCRLVYRYVQIYLYTCILYIYIFKLMTQTWLTTWILWECSKESCFESFFFQSKANLSLFPFIPLLRGIWKSPQGMILSRRSRKKDWIMICFSPQKISDSEENRTPEMSRRISKLYFFLGKFDDYS